MVDIVDILNGVVIMLAGYIHQRNESRFSKLEEKIDKSVTKEDFRQILEDKIEPLRDDITEIKDYCNKIELKIDTKR